MRPVSAQFNNIVRGSHTIAVRVRALTTYQTGVNPVGTELTVIKGDVVLDSSADIRGTLDVTVDGTNAFTSDSDGLLTPYGNEIFVERGIVYGSGTREMVSQGYYRIYTVTQAGEPDSPIRITGRDRMSGVLDARLLAPMQFLAGTSVQTIFQTLVTEVFPLAVIEFDYNAASDTIGRDQIADEDRYAFLRDLARSRGKVMYWDYAGKLQVKTAPSSSAIVFDVNAGQDGVLITLDRELTREGVYNAVVATGQAPDSLEPVRAQALDMNPNSPTFWNGKFGRVPRYFFSTFLTTVAQCATAARSILERILGLPYNVDFNMVPNPALEPLDPIRITHEDGYENHILERVAIPLTVDDPMTGRTREKTEVIIETELG